MYLGTKSVVGATYPGVIKELWPNTSGGVDDYYEINAGTDSNILDLSAYAIDAAVAGDSDWVKR
jgi:hypothetical protein